MITQIFHLSALIEFLRPGIGYSFPLPRRSHNRWRSTKFFHYRAQSVPGGHIVADLRINRTLGVKQIVPDLAAHQFPYWPQSNRSWSRSHGSNGQTHSQTFSAVPHWIARMSRLKVGLIPAAALIHQPDQKLPLDQQHIEGNSYIPRRRWDR